MRAAASGVGWSIRLRRAVLLLVPVVLVAALGGFAWLTWHPRSPLLARAERWSVIGPLARALRQRYGAAGAQASGPPPPEMLETASAETPAPEPRSRTAPVRVPPDAVVDARPLRWVEPGAILRRAPHEGAAVVATIDALADLPIETERDGWQLLRWRGVRGWLRAPAEDARPPLGSAPEPLLPLPEEAPDPQRLARLAAALGPDRTTLPLGPYELVTDVRDRGLLILLQAAAAQLEPVYRRRYGVDPLPGARAVVVLFDAPAAYRQGTADDLAGEAGGVGGHTFRGVVALYRGGRQIEDVRATLVHELVHLLNRRSLGPALPPWLDEGLAEDLGESAYDAEGKLLPGTLARLTAPLAGGYRLYGGVVGLQALLAAAPARVSTASELVRLDRAGFLDPAGRLERYAEAGLWVSYLLQGARAPAFRAWLAAVAAGRPTSPESLEAQLGVSSSELEAPFREWLRELARSQGVLPPPAAD